MAAAACSAGRDRAGTSGTTLTNPLLLPPFSRQWLVRSLLSLSQRCCGRSCCPPPPTGLQRQEDVMDAVVKIYCTHTEPNYSLVGAGGWKKNAGAEQHRSIIRTRQWAERVGRWSTAAVLLPACSIGAVADSAAPVPLPPARAFLYAALAAQAAVRLHQLRLCGAGGAGGAALPADQRAQRGVLLPGGRFGF